MDVQQFEVHSAPAVEVSAGWDNSVARLLSIVFSPPVMLVLTILLIAIMSNDSAVWPATFLYILLVGGLPLLTIAWLVKTNRATDMDLSHREQRVKPLMLAVVAIGVGWLMLSAVDAPQLLTALALSNLILATVFLLITLTWKISMHCTAMGVFSVVAGVLFGLPILLAGLGLTGLIAWARVRLHRHTFGQTVAGTLLGATTVTVVFLAYGVVS